MPCAHSDTLSLLKRTKVAVIREEFVELTGHPFRAILLNQLYYWTQKVSDFDELLQEEVKRTPDCKCELRHGWIYKSAPTFIAETLLKVSKYTFYRHINKLLESGFVESRDNADTRWDNTRSYRLNLKRIQEELSKLGYDLPPVYQDTYKKMAQIPTLHVATSMLQTEPSMLHNAPSKNKIINKTMDKKDVNKTSNTKINTDVDESACAYARDKFSSDCQVENVKSIKKDLQVGWEKGVGKEEALSDEDYKSLQSCFYEFFGGKQYEWEIFCEIVGRNKSLMDRGIKLKWISKRINMQKILKGFKENGEYPLAKKVPTNQGLMDESQSHVDSISDPIWKEICQCILDNHGSKSREDIQTFLRSEIWRFILGDVLNDRICRIYLPSGNYAYNNTDYNITTYHSLSEQILCNKFSNLRKLVGEISISRVEEDVKFFLNDSTAQDKDRLESILKEIEKRKGKDGTIHKG